MKKIFLFVAIIFFMNFSLCSAKLIYDTSGRISFETSNYWYPVSMGEDAVIMELHSVALDKDTAVTFKQSKFISKYKSMRSISYSEKSILRDNTVQFHINLFKSQNYSVVVNKTDVFNDFIITGFTLYKNGFEYKAVMMFTMKDYIFYSINVLATSSTAYEAMNVANSLKIDGIQFKNWILH